MKKLITLLALVFCLNGKAQFVSIPDSNFVHYLKTIVLPAFKGDSLDTTSTLVTTTTQTINVSNKGISDLTGISYFKSLRYLDCSYNLGLNNIPTLPNSLRYLNCNSSEGNPPTYFPPLLDTLKADATGWTSIPPLPNSLIYLSLNADLITCFPPFPPSVQYADISGNLCMGCCLPNYPNGLITNNGYPYASYPLCGPGNFGGCQISPSCTPAISYTLVANPTPHTWDVYPTYPAYVDSVTWYWGDGTDTTALYPSHTYSVAGKYNICVYTTASSGCQAGYCQNDTVYRLSNNNTLSNMVSVNVLNNAAGINQIINKNDFSIYPNPTSDQFFIDANTTDKINVDLYDVNGRHVFNASISDKSNINVATIDNGAYTLTIKTADRVINKKLVILR